MARSTITAVALPAIASSGYNLTDSAGFSVLGTGTGNGVKFTYDANDLIILKNTTGGAAVYTFVLATPASITSVGGSVTSPTISVAAGKTHLVRLADILKQTDDLAYIDCDVAGSLLVLNL